MNLIVENALSHAPFSGEMTREGTSADVSVTQSVQIATACFVLFATHCFALRRRDPYFASGFRLGQRQSQHLPEFRDGAAHGRRCVFDTKLPTASISCSSSIFSYCIQFNVENSDETAVNLFYLPANAESIAARMVVNGDVPDRRRVPTRIIGGAPSLALSVQLISARICRNTR